MYRVKYPWQEKKGVERGPSLTNTFFQRCPEYDCRECVQTFSLYGGNRIGQKFKYSVLRSSFHKSYSFPRHPQCSLFKSARVTRIAFWFPVVIFVKLLIGHCFINGKLMTSLKNLHLWIDIPKLNILVGELRLLTPRVAYAALWIMFLVWFTLPLWSAVV